MRFFSLLTAFLVIASLYLLLFQRQAILEFAGSGTAEGAGNAGDSGAAGDRRGAAQPSPPEPAAGPGAESPAEAGPDRAGVSVIALKSIAQQIDSAVVLHGRTEASRRVDVMAETSGQVISPPLAKGSWVEAGDVLCRLDPGTREAALTEARARLAEARARIPEARARLAEAESQVPAAEARLAEARARLAEAERNHAAAIRLQEGGYASQSRVDSTLAALESARAGVQNALSQLESARAAVLSAQSQVETALAGVQSAEAQVAAARLDIENLTITAPFAGLLESDAAELGSLLQPGARCATLVRLDPIRLVGFVPEAEVAKIRPGIVAGGRLGNGRELVGTVSFLSRVSDPQTRTFRVEVEVANPDRSVSDGLTVEMLIPSAGRQAHLLPQSALTLDDEGRLGVRVVERDAQGRDIARFAPVELVRDTLDGVWVAGLADTAAVIVVGQNYVVDGVVLDVSWKEPGS